MGHLSVLKRMHDWTGKILFLRNLNERQGLSMGKGVCVPGGSLIESETEIGDYTKIDGPIVIKGNERVEIGKYCAIGDDVRVISTNHQVHHANVQLTLHNRHGFECLIESRGPVILGNALWIGDRVTILPGVRVGDGAVIGASGVVTKNVPPFAIAVGVPARVIKKRFPDTIIDELMRIGWWDWSIDRIHRNRRFFEADLRSISVEALRALVK